MHFHGIWDLDELYDLTADPCETDNLLASPGHEDLAERMSARLFAILEQAGGMQIPLSVASGARNDLRDASGSPQALFPPSFVRGKKNGG